MHANHDKKGKISERQKLVQDLKTTSDSHLILFWWKKKA